jgi:hypothetical protein
LCLILLASESNVGAQSLTSSPTVSVIPLGFGLFSNLSFAIFRTADLREALSKRSLQELMEDKTFVQKSLVGGTCRAVSDLTLYTADFALNFKVITRPERTENPEKGTIHYKIRLRKLPEMKEVVQTDGGSVDVLYKHCLYFCTLGGSSSADFTPVFSWVHPSM